MTDNPPAFPNKIGFGTDAAGMDLRDWFATFAPQPSDEQINSQHEYDRARNPHNEPYHNKPQRRSRERIIADLRYQHADAMLQARRQS